MEQETNGPLSPAQPTGRPEYRYANGAVPPAIVVVSSTDPPADSVWLEGTSDWTVGRAFTTTVPDARPTPPSPSIALTPIVNVPADVGWQESTLTFALAQPEGRPT